MLYLTNESTISLFLSAAIISSALLSNNRILLSNLITFCAKGILKFNPGSLITFLGSRIVILWLVFFVPQKIVYCTQLTEHQLQ